MISYIVSVIVWFISLIFGFLSCLYCEKDNIRNSNGGTIPASDATVTILSSVFTRKNITQNILVVMFSLLCGISAFFRYDIKEGLFSYICQIAVIVILLSAMIIDFKTFRIPNFLVLTLYIIGVLVLLAVFIFQREFFTARLLSSIIGCVCSLVFFYLMSRLTKDGIGMGDVKIISAMGWLVGIGQTLCAVLIALILCTVIAVFLMVVRKKDKKTQIPFGPFLFFGYIFVLIMLSI